MINFILKCASNNVNKILKVTWDFYFFNLIVIFIFFEISGICSAIVSTDGRYIQVGR